MNIENILKAIKRVIANQEFNQYSKDEQIEIIELLYNKFMRFNEEFNKEYNESEFILFVCENLKEVEERTKHIDELLKDKSLTKLLKLRVSLEDYPLNYRIITVPSLYSVSELVYFILATFNATLCTDYILKHENSEFVPTINRDFDESQIPAEYFFIEEFDLKEKDILYLAYNQNEWLFKIEVQEVTQNIKMIEDAKLNKKCGIDILEDEVEIFETLYNNDLEALDSFLIDDGYIDYLKEMYRTKCSLIKKSELEERYYEITDMFESSSYNEDDDEYYYDEDYEFDEDELSDELKEKYDELLRNYQEQMKDPMLKKYYNAKELYNIIIDSVYKFYEKNQEEFDKKVSMLLSIRHHNNSSDRISFSTVKLSDSSINNIIITRLLPFIEGYVSPIEIVYSNEKSVNDINLMYQALMNTVVGLFEIVGSDKDKGLVLLRNIKTKEEIEVMDLNLSHSAFILDETPYIACRLCTYDDITFIISADFVFESDELDAYIKTYLKFDHNDLDFFVNIAKIRANQNDPRVK